MKPAKSESASTSAGEGGDSNQGSAPHALRAQRIGEKTHHLRHAFMTWSSSQGAHGAKEPESDDALHSQAGTKVFANSMVGARAATL